MSIASRTTLYLITLPYYIVNQCPNLIIFYFSEYGFLHSQKCEKFILNDYDPMDNRYISHIDGSMYITNFPNSKFNNDNYCIEYANVSGFIMVSTYNNKAG